MKGNNTSNPLKMVGARLKQNGADLTPLVEKWMEKNPNVATSHLVRIGLKLALKPYAGKRYAHLVEN